jgi:hypothetical protein
VTWSTCIFLLSVKEKIIIEIFIRTLNSLERHGVTHTDGKLIWNLKIKRSVFLHSSDEVARLFDSIDEYSHVSSRSHIEVTFSLIQLDFCLLLPLCVCRRNHMKLLISRNSFQYGFGSWLKSNLLDVRRDMLNMNPSNCKLHSIKIELQWSIDRLKYMVCVLLPSILNTRVKFLDVFSEKAPTKKVAHDLKYFS